MKPNGSIIVYNIFAISVRCTNENILVPFNEELMKSIMQREAIAATNALVKDYNMGECQIITDTEERIRIENVLYYKQQEENTPEVAEVMVLLELIVVLEKKGRHIQSGEIRIGFDNKQAYRKIINKLMRSNIYA